MRPYLAVIKDSFREAFATRVLWIVLFLIVVFLAIIAPLGYDTVLPVSLTLQDLRSPETFIERLKENKDNAPAARIWGKLPSDLKTELSELQSDEAVSAGRFGLYARLVAELNEQLRSPDFYDKAAWENVLLTNEATKLQERGLDQLSDDERSRFHRLAFDSAFRGMVNPAGGEAVQIKYLHYDLGSDVPFSSEQLTESVSAVIAAVVSRLVGNIGVFVALLVTASIVPQMLDAGACDLLLSKPVSRPLLLLSKFLGGCAFILLCAAFLHGGLWLIAGLRFGIWNAGLLYSIPVFVFVFAIYYSVSTAAAMIWRNAVVSIVCAILFWAMCFTVGVAKSQLDLWVLDARRTAAIVPVRDSLLIANWEGAVFEWTAGDWRELYREEQQGSPAPAFVRGYPFLGPFYDPSQDRIVAVRTPFRGGWVPTPGTLEFGKRADQWKLEESIRVPNGTTNLFVGPQGEVLVAGERGFYQFVAATGEKGQGGVKVLGFEVPLTSNRDKFVSILDDTLWTKPVSAALQADAQRLAVVSGATVATFGKTESGKYESTATVERIDASPAHIGLAGGIVAMARKDGKIRILSADSLEQIAEHEPFGNNEPRAIATSPDGRWIAVVYHHRRVWIFDTQSKTPVSFKLRAQGSISAIAFDSDNGLYAADGFGRVILYNPASGFTETKRWEPEPDLLEQIYTWGISPIYTIFPKPGEMENLVSWLMTRQKTVGEDVEGRDTQRIVLNIWQPLWSNLLFLSVMLLITSVYFSRKDF